MAAKICVRRKPGHEQTGGRTLPDQLRLDRAWRGILHWELPNPLVAVVVPIAALKDSRRKALSADEAEARPARTGGAGQALVMEPKTEQELQERPWQPLKLLQRFRARVTALSSWDNALPVERETAEPANSAYSCDVAVVCADATPSQTLLRRRLEQASSQVERKVITEVHQRLATLYSLNGSPPQPHQVERILSATTTAQHVGNALAPDLGAFLAGPLNDALCREQALEWLVEMKLRIHLYGPGFEDHPRLRPFVHFYNGTDQELGTIYQAAKISLRLTPSLVTDPLLASGIRNGAFFLMRFFPQDVIERIERPIYQYCQEQGIRTDQELRARASDAIHRLIDFAGRTLGASPFEIHASFVEWLERRAEQGFGECPGGLWDEYDAVAFSSGDELKELIELYLANAPDRRRIAGAMRRTFVEKTEGSAKARPAEAKAQTEARASGEVAA